MLGFLTSYFFDLIIRWSSMETSVAFNNSFEHLKLFSILNVQIILEMVIWYLYFSHDWKLTFIRKSSYLDLLLERSCSLCRLLMVVFVLLERKRLNVAQSKEHTKKLMRQMVKNVFASACLYPGAFSRT